MTTYIRRQQHKKKFIHQDIKQKEPPQKYRLGTISNTKHISATQAVKFVQINVCLRAFFSTWVF